MELYGVIASSIAARTIGRTRLAELILAELASPQRVALLFTMSASKDSGKDLAFILLAGAHARYKTRPGQAYDNVEYELARAALARQIECNVERVIRDLGAKAECAVTARWPEIESTATGILAARIFKGSRRETAPAMGRSRTVC